MGMGRGSSRHEIEEKEKKKKEKKGWGGRKRKDERKAKANRSIPEAADRQTYRRQFAAGGNGFQCDHTCQQITQP